MKIEKGDFVVTNDVVLRQYRLVREIGIILEKHERPSRVTRDNRWRSGSVTVYWVDIGTKTVVMENTLEKVG